jgi:hypothetical protein
VGVSVGSVHGILPKDLNMNQHLIPKETSRSLAGASTIFPGHVTATLSPVSVTKKCSKRTMIQSAEEVTPKVSRALTEAL